MENNHYNNLAQTLPNTIRQSFFLKPDFEISNETIDAFNTGLLTQNFEPIIPHLQNNHNDSFTVYITHDIDWLSLWHPYSFVNYIRSYFSKHQWFSSKQLWNKDALLQNIEQLLKLENELSLNATYCIGAQQKLHLGRYDIRYSAGGSLYAELVSLITAHKQSIGLHSSYNACKNNRIKTEFETLKKHTSQHITTHRSHYLKVDTNFLYTQLENTGIKYDLGFGEARTIGLLNSFPGKFKPYNQFSNRVANVTVVPLVLMDNIFFVKSYHQVITQFKEVLTKVQEYNGSVCISFHPENMLLKPQLYNYFEEIIHICKQQGARLNTPLA